jgi:hypothetical protein|tara:strand:- start:83 stop:547 length:465 start_codon:yes stop_codon:yes gene_type:complete
MDENHPLDIFLQPSKRLILLSVFFVLTCSLLLYNIPLTYLYKLLLFSIISIGTLVELRLKVFLTSPRSIIRLGCDGGVMDGSGNISDIFWWYQRRSGGDKVYVILSSNSRVWADWVSLDFGGWPWQIGQAVLIARDSVEDPKDFQRLKRLLRSR